MKDVLIIILLFILIVFFGRQIVSHHYTEPIPTEKSEFDRELEDWQPFIQK